MVIEFRLNLAAQYLEDAKMLLQNERWNSAIGRAYYASYQAMWAALNLKWSFCFIEQLHERFSEIRIRSIAPYEDEEFALEILVPTGVNIEEVEEFSLKECIYLEDHYDVYLLVKVSRMGWRFKVRSDVNNGHEKPHFVKLLPFLSYCLRFILPTP